MIGQFLSATWTFFERLFKSAFGFIANLFGFLFQKLFDFLKMLLKPVFILIAILFYFIWKIGELAILLLQVLLAIAKLFFSLVKGIFVTLAGFSYTPTTPQNGQWTSVFQNVMSGLDSYQLDVVAYILLFLIWFGTAFAAIRILSSMRGGDD